MAKIADEIRSKALEILAKSPAGVRYADLVRQVARSDGKLKLNTIHGTLWDLDQQVPEKVYKPSRGLYRLEEYRDPDTDQLKDGLGPKRPKRIQEEEFYEPFADWLQNDLEDCTKAISLGGKKFRDKWGTPDVIGKRESRRSDIIQGPVEIVSAEIKPDENQLVTAFGQACAYCLFSHRSYLVIPVQAPQDEIARLDALCQVFGIGLVLFNTLDAKTPDFSIRVRPRKQEPDLFYVNKYMKLIENELFS